MTTTTAPDIGSYVWQRARGDTYPPGGMVVDDVWPLSPDKPPDHVVVLNTDPDGPIVHIRQRDARQAHGIPTVRTIRIDVDDIEPLTVSPPSLPQMHKVGRQALATVAVGRGDLSDDERELLGYAVTLMEAV